MVQPVARDKLPVSPGKPGCPINMTIELLGDRWSLIVLRDIMFGGNTHFRELLASLCSVRRSAGHRKLVTPLH
jgi:DNA-binding HxlR family transcriptional regulator